MLKVALANARTTFSKTLAKLCTRKHTHLRVNTVLEKLNVDHPNISFFAFQVKSV